MERQDVDRRRGGEDNIKECTGMDFSSSVRAKKGHDEEGDVAKPSVVLRRPTKIEWNRIVLNSF